MKYTAFEKVVTAVIAVTAIMTFGAFILAAMVLYQVITYTSDNGVKPIAEIIWCGKPGCTDGVPQNKAKERQ